MGDVRDQAADGPGPEHRHAVPERAFLRRNARMATAAGSTSAPSSNGVSSPAGSRRARAIMDSAKGQPHPSPGGAPSGTGWSGPAGRAGTSCTRSGARPPRGPGRGSPSPGRRPPRPPRRPRGRGRRGAGGTGAGRERRPCRIRSAARADAVNTSSRRWPLVCPAPRWLDICEDDRSHPGPGCGGPRGGRGLGGGSRGREARAPRRGSRPRGRTPPRAGRRARRARRWTGEAAREVLDVVLDADPHVPAEEHAEHDHVDPRPGADPRDTPDRARGKGVDHADKRARVRRRPAVEPEQELEVERIVEEALGGEREHWWIIPSWKISSSGLTETRGSSSRARASSGAAPRAGTPCSSPSCPEARDLGPRLSVASPPAADVRGEVEDDVAALPDALHDGGVELQVLGGPLRVAHVHVRDRPARAWTSNTDSMISSVVTAKGVSSRLSSPPLIPTEMMSLSMFTRGRERGDRGRRWRRRRR